MSALVPFAYWVDGEPGLCHVPTPAERLEADIERVGRAYDAMHAACWPIARGAEMSARLDGALTMVGECLDELVRKRETLREQG